MPQLHKLLAFKLLLLLSINSYANDLLTSFRLAYEYDPTILAAKEQHLAELEALPQARALLLPTISFNATSTTNRARTIATTLYHSRSDAFTLTQPIFYYANWLNRSKANDVVKKANAMWAASEQQLILKVIQYYFAVLQAQDDLAFSKAQQLAFKKSFEDAKQKYEVGLTPITDLHTAKAKYFTSLAQIEQDELTLKLELDKLQDMLGTNIGSLHKLKNNFPLKAITPNKMEFWLDTALENNPNLIAKRSDVKITTKEIKAQNAEHLPKLDLVSSISNNTLAPNYTGRQHSSYIGIQLSIPLFSGGATISKTKAARHLNANNAFKLQDLHRSIETEVRRAFRAITANISKVNAYAEAVNSNNSAVETNQVAYESGTKTIVDVLNAQSDLVKAKRDYAKARYDYILELVKLKLVCGVLNPEDIIAINSWLIP